MNTPVGAYITPERAPGVEFVYDKNSWQTPLPSIPFSLRVNPEMYRRKIWFAFGYVGAADANFNIDSRVVFSFKGETIFELPVQYNINSSNTVGAPCDVYWSANPVIVNPIDFVLNDEPMFASGGSGHITALGATPFRGTFVCDKVEWKVIRSKLTGTERLYAFLVVQSEYPY